MSTGPLSGIRVFDLTLAAVGPWSSMNLGALGADVIHVEPPPQGSSSRRDGAFRGPRGLTASAKSYINVMMNKRCITLDLKSPADRATAYELLKTCDVFVNNMRPGVAARLGVGYEAVSAINDQIIYCAISGWGQDGPMSGVPGSDPPVRYLTGFHEGTGASGEGVEGYRFAGQMDYTTGNYSAQAMIMALLARKRTGRGQRIEITMMNASAAAQSIRIGESLATGLRPPTLGSAAQSTAPDAAFPCADSRYVGISVTSEAEWVAFCQAIARPALLEDPRFATNPDRVDHRDELTEILNEVLHEFPLAYWELTFQAAGIPCGHVIQWSELHEHRQILENNFLAEIKSPDWGEMWTGGPPYHLSVTPERQIPTALIGAHNEEILKELEERRNSAANATVAVAKDN